MKTILLYYSFMGSTKIEAEKIAEETCAVLCRIEEEKATNMLKAFIFGCPHALKRKAERIKPIQYELKSFDKIIIGAPVWAGFPAPVFNSIVQALPPGKEIELFFCSGGGSTPKSKQGTIDFLESKECKVLSYKDICTRIKKY